MRLHIPVPSLLEARCVSLAVRDPMAHALMCLRCSWTLGGLSSMCMASSSVPTALCSGVLGAHCASGLASDAVSV